MTSRIAQAQLIAKQQAIQRRAAFIQGLQDGTIPMSAIMDQRAPLSDHERQTLWNHMALRSNSPALSSGPRTDIDLSEKEVTPQGRTVRAPNEAAVALVSRYGRPDGPISGTRNQLAQSLSLVERSPEWNALDNETRGAVLQRLYGNEIASKYVSSLEDQKVIDAQRRKTFDDSYETGRVIEREKRQSAARYANLEPEMVYQNFKERNWVQRPEGIFERNPEYNPSDISKQNIPQYIPLNPAGEAMVARQWDSMMPGRPNPIHPEKLARIRIAEENPDLPAEEIARRAAAQYASMIAQNNQVPGAAVRYNIPTSDDPNKKSGNTPEMRMGQRLHGMVESAGSAINNVNPLFNPLNPIRQAAAFIPRVESALTNFGNTAVRQVPQFISDLFGNPASIDPMVQAVTNDPYTPVRPEDTMSSRLLPEWLK